MKKLFQQYYLNLFLTDRLFTALGLCVVLFLLKFFFAWLGDIPEIATGVLLIFFLIDVFILYRVSEGVDAKRFTSKRLSNGDENPVQIEIKNRYGFGVNVRVIDEVPFQFQLRDKDFRLHIKPAEIKSIHYNLRPTKRGEYNFGFIRAYISSPLGLISRRYNFDGAKTLPVYPSFINLGQYELMAVSHHLTAFGIKKIRKVGHSSEFDQIKNYVGGDDIRTINWKATARKGGLMVNTYTDERSQNIYCIIDKSRVMKMPFEGLSLLDYAINASVALAKVAMLKEDKAGLITVSENIGAVVPADRKSAQLGNIMNVLYKEKTRYLESNLEALYAAVRSVVKQRGLLVFFTNFESLSALQRQLPYLKRISKYHLLVVVFFENTELKALSSDPAKDVEGIYHKTIAEKFMYEKKLMVKELNAHGILAILTPPQKLTVNVINQYLALKAQQRI
ncbi:cell division protein DivIC (FtsB), stabilizes FtsL against RasP cleavage [Pedobacter kyungheensis]|uniref:Cell division protein DivIC (FtsB), stabilizes FtsL against RasP cleavage n=1 Tax=Pedobacter kyungheensis TaxID=1069985 RepID=A0A0C1DGX2_9SPHI|nr:DUF58 domain-containing protein [Pedobacter kyungheensis]KIA93160.1 cell division protein DivIC (FtsB), stabilizes FtsL against RasP cleavage [Pedobacter kyungheensis]